MTVVAYNTQPAADRDKRPSLLRLTTVELRKATDTHAGLWLLLSAVALTITLTVVTASVGHAQDHTLRNLIGAALFPMTVLLPVVGILLVSSEWSQRTGMLTFALVPHRLRVLAAKFAAASALSIVALVVALGVGATAAAITPDQNGAFPASIVGQEAVLVTTAMIVGLAFGAALLSSPPAIVLYFALPLAFQALGAIPGFDGPAGWLDGSRSLAHMTDRALTSTEWARAGTTIAVWVLIPLLIGAWRIVRSDVR